MNADAPRALPGLGDRVRFRDAYVPAHGVVVDELTETYVQVKWDGVADPTTHRRDELQIDPAPAPASEADG
jgi:hypothetical protein